jgi:hypothetical protein
MIEEGGFTVWWDPARLPGEHYHDIIQSEIDAAGCIVVAWSFKSVGSKWVRDDASEGEMRRNLPGQW